MGQKVNPAIFRLNQSEAWKTKFFEKKSKELPEYIFRDLELSNYLRRFFAIHNLALYDYRVYYTNSSINIYFSYFVPPLPTLNNNIKFPTSVKLMKQNGETSKMTLLNRDDCQKDYLLKQLIKGVHLFFPQKHKLTLIFNCLNKQVNLSQVELSFLNKSLMLLQKFKNSDFFLEGFNVCFYAVTSAQSAQLIGDFLTKFLKTIKRQKYFLSFLKKTLVIFIYAPFSQVQGIKIVLKGRLNGAPRARHRVLAVGNVSTQTINTLVDYYQTTVTNSNGSYGIKVYISMRS